MGQNAKTLGVSYGRGPGGDYKDKQAKMNAVEGIRADLNPAPSMLLSVMPPTIGFTSNPFFSLAPGICDYPTVQSRGLTAAQNIQVSQMIKDYIRACNMGAYSGAPTRYWDGGSGDDAVVGNNSFVCGATDTLGPFWISGTTLQTGPGNILATLAAIQADAASRPETVELWAVPWVAGDVYLSLVNQRSGHFIAETGEVGMPAGSVKLLSAIDVSGIAGGSQYLNAAVPHTLDGVYGLAWCIYFSIDPYEYPTVIPAAEAPLTLSSS